MQILPVKPLVTVTDPVFAEHEMDVNIVCIDVHFEDAALLSVMYTSEEGKETIT